MLNAPGEVAEPPANTRRTRAGLPVADSRIGVSGSPSTRTLAYRCGTTVAVSCTRSRAGRWKNRGIANWPNFGARAVGVRLASENASVAATWAVAGPAATAGDGRYRYGERNGSAR